MALGILKHPRVGHSRYTAPRTVNVHTYIYRAGQMAWKRRRVSAGTTTIVGRGGYCAVAYVTPGRSVARGMSLLKKRERRSERRCAKTPTAAFKAAMRDLLKKVK